ncbi:hypothetical protein EV356DRAFT_573398 [Viridothelium virens]|uniref:Uncharacterized protein n=1 Tax=Viridothelium virens TaxID=1048519 RepID=A0A6A6HJZ7_VIRVR|nr:hypothetical protein EV356DRAFT_573398 [Viridothelium virens]
MLSVSKLSAALLLLTPLLSTASPLEKRQTYDVNVTIHANSKYASDGFNLTQDALVLNSGQWIVEPAEFIPAGGNTTFAFTAGIQTSPAGLLLQATIPYRAQMTEFGNGPFIDTYLAFDLNTAQRPQASFTHANNGGNQWFYIYDSYSDDLSGLGTHVIDVYIQDQ